jgi:hypothetical protein
MANIRRRIFSFHFSDALGRRRRAPNFLVFPYNFSIQHRLPLFIFISPALLISRLPPICHITLPLFLQAQQRISRAYTFGISPAAAQGKFVKARKDRRPDATQIALIDTY